MDPWVSRYVLNAERDSGGFGSGTAPKNIFERFALAPNGSNQLPEIHVHDPRSSVYLIRYALLFARSCTHHEPVAAQYATVDEDPSTVDMGTHFFPLSSGGLLYR
jgi:hypothetical protein